MASKKKVAKKKAVKKKAVPKRAPASRRAPAPRRVSTPQASNTVLNTVLNRMVDVVEANTLVVKATMTAILQLQQMLQIILDPVHHTGTPPTQEQTAEKKKADEEIKKEKARLRKLNKAKKDAATLGEIPPPVETDVTVPAETATTPMPTMAQLSAGFKNMKGMIGEAKALEYLGRHNGCQSISALEEKYWRVFRDGAKNFVEGVRADEVEKKAELEATGVTDQPTYTEAQVRQALNDVANAYGKQDVNAGRKHAIGLLAKFKATTVPQLDKAHYGELMNSCSIELINVGAKLS